MILLPRRARVLSPAPPPLGAPNFAALPVLSRQQPDLSLLAARRALPAGAMYADETTGVQIIKLTDSTNVTQSLGVWYNYAEGGPFVSHAWANGMRTVRIPTTSGGGFGFLDVDTVSGAVSSIRPTAPQDSSFDVGFGFSPDGTTPLLGYFLSGSRLYAYNTQTMQRIAAGAVPASGRDFSSFGATFLIWLTVVADGWVCFMQALGPDAQVFFYNVVTDEVVTRFAENVDQLHPTRDGAAALLMPTTGVLPALIWRRAQNDIVTPTGGVDAYNGGHAAGGIGVWYDVNPHSGLRESVRTLLTPPSAAGINTSASNLATTGTHHAGQFAQVGVPPTEQWIVGDTLGPADQIAVSPWTVHSGSIYIATPTFIYQFATRGVTAVYQHDGTTYQQALQPRASVAAMTPGTFHFQASPQRVYVWLTDGASPSGRVKVMASAGNAHGVAAFKMDGLDARLICHHGNWQTDYRTCPFATWSTDGRVLVFRSNMGVRDGRMDAYMALLPGV